MAALRKLPYIPLYVNDFSCDEKLRMCSASAVGVYIFLMCVLHKSEIYGVLTLRRYKNNSKPDSKTYGKSDSKTIAPRESLLYEFVELLRRQMPFSVEEIKDALEELLFYEVIVIEGKTLYQPRMKKDGEKSEKRVRAGQVGAQSRWNDDEEDNNDDRKPIAKPIANVMAKPIANTLANAENEYVYENNIDKEEKEVQEKRKRTTFEPPTLEDVLSYCDERKNGVDAVAFYDFYEANGWVQGKQGKPLKDWKAAVRYWERNGINYKTNNDGRQQTTTPTGGFGEVRTDTPAKKTRHTSV